MCQEFCSWGGVCQTPPPPDRLVRHPPRQTFPGRQTPPLVDTIQARHPPGQTPPGRQVPPQAATLWADTPTGQIPPGHRPPGQMTTNRPDTHLWADTPPPPPPPQADGYCSGRYASYWNEFLFIFRSMFICCIQAFP